MPTYPKSLFQSAIIGNIFTLGHASVHKHANFVDFVFGILIYYALGTLTKRFNGDLNKELLKK